MTDTRTTPTELAALAPLLDEVTGLPGRALFFDHLQLAGARLNRSSNPLAVLAIDVDGFKVLNDGLGHQAGDKLLAELGRRIAAAVRPGDTVARLGADEFGVVCGEISEARDAVVIAERVCLAVSHPIELAGRDICPTVSVGIALALDPWTSPTELVGNAATAVHRAQESGRGRVEIFDTALRSRLVERLEVETGLRRALLRGELRLDYQPQFDVVGGRMSAVEALLRWDHPERGLVMPGDFIAIAEASGVIVPLGEWVLRRATREAAEWARRGVQLSVNVSARELEEPAFADTVAAILGETRFPPECLCLELTETALMRSPEAALSVLTAVKEHGINVAIDDFGVGFSSLSQLRDLLPLHQLKVDRSFVSAIGSDPRSRAIVGAVLLMSNSLGLSAVAEGVETAEQLAELSALGCDATQGFYLARPQGADAIDMLLKAPAGRGAQVIW